jgi:outer membrane protein assembly factor BamB
MACVLVVATAGLARADDWPTYRRDIARSGTTAETIGFPLAPEWTFAPAVPPAAGWGEAERGAVWKLDIPFQQSVRYDDAYHVAVVGSLVYFAASAEHAVYCLDAAKGEIRWVAFTAAPARCAPTVHDGKVYVGADDGCVYCFGADDGVVVWQRSAAPHGDRAVGQGRIVSLWPVRTGVLVDGQRAYFGAGIYPNLGLRLCAVGAADGAEGWTQSDFGRNADATPQGYLLADSQRIVVPSGRTFPSVFDRATGKWRGRITAGRCPPNGGAYAVLAGGDLINGTSCLTAYGLNAAAKDKWGRDVFAPPLWSWFKTQAVVADDEMVYLTTDRDVFAVPRAEIAKACGATTGFDTNKTPDWSKCTWRQTEQCVADALILAGNCLIAGGPNKVAAYDAASGEMLWSAAVEGSARGLAVANGRLLVSTTTGHIYSFARTGSNAKSIAPPAQSTPFPDDDLTAFYARTADAIAAESAVRSGFCLIVGGAAEGRPGQLAYELAKRTDWRIELLESDPRRAADVRRRLHGAGLYGTRIGVDSGTLETYGYPPYFANVVVCEGSFFGARSLPPVVAVSKVLRPCGGVAFVGQPAGGARFGWPLEPRVLATWVGALDKTFVAQSGPTWAVIRRNSLAGSAEWTHQGADPGNTYGSGDRLVKPPFGILWFGEPGPRDVQDRHAAGAAPLAANGRLFVPGVDLLMAYDAYNGHLLWDRKIPGMHRERMPLNCSSLAADETRIFVVVDRACLQLDAATGAEQRRFDLPPRVDGQKRLWGWLAVADGLLLGSRTATPAKFKGWPNPSGHTSESLFAMDLASGRTLWTREGRTIPHNAIALIGRRLFFVDRSEDETKEDAATADRDVRRLVAVEAATGRELWQQPVDVTDCVVHPRPNSGDCCGGEVTLMGKDATLVLCGSPYHADHELEPFHRGDLARRSLTVFDTESGRKLWSRPANYQTRPIIIGETIFAEPWAFDLSTGEPKLDETGKPLRIFRGAGGGCGGFAASASTLFFRKGSLSYLDFDRGGSMEPLVGGQRPSCWISFIPAGGIVLAPEGSAGCTCAFAIQGSVALYPKDATNP